MPKVTSEFSTKAVDYLVAAEDAFEGSIVRNYQPGVPFRVGTVEIDYVTAQPTFPQVIRGAMAAIVPEVRSRLEDVVVVFGWLPVWMKLNTRRNKDVAGIEGWSGRGERPAGVGPRRYRARLACRSSGV